jgi:hypothetical protein
MDRMKHKQPVPEFLDRISDDPQCDPEKIPPRVKKQQHPKPGASAHPATCHTTL